MLRIFFGVIVHDGEGKGKGCIEAVEELGQLNHAFQRIVVDRDEGNVDGQDRTLREVTRVAEATETNPLSPLLALLFRLRPLRLWTWVLSLCAAGALQIAAVAFDGHQSFFPLLG